MDLKISDLGWKRGVFLPESAKRGSQTWVRAWMGVGVGLGISEGRAGLLVFILLYTCSRISNIVQYNTMIGAQINDRFEMEPLKDSPHCVLWMNSYEIYQELIEPGWLISIMMWMFGGCFILNTGARLFWCDAYTDRIESCDLNGHGRRTIYREDDSHFFGIAVLGGIIFYTDWTKKWAVRLMIIWPVLLRKLIQV